jgi:predicted RNase H-like HicB family nuclease
MKTMQFPVTLYHDEDGWYVVECPIIPGCMSQGETEAEALRNIQEAIQLCLGVRRERTAANHREPTGRSPRVCLNHRPSPASRPCASSRKPVGRLLASAAAMSS